MPISFKCVACDKALRVADDKQGKKIKCTGCGAVVTVPDDDDDEEAEPEPARRSKKPVKGKGKRSKAKSSGIPPLVWVGVAGVGVIAIGLLVWSLTRRGGTAATDGQIANSGSSTSTSPSSNSASPVDKATMERSQDEKRLKELALAMHNYHDLHMQFPIADQPENFGADGRPFLSWRVHLLPVLSQLDLYKKFHLNEAWDSPHNKTLIDQMPDVFRSGSDRGTSTRMLTLTGPHGLFFQRKVGLRQITDGSSNTVLIAQVGPEKAVPWTKPDDVVVDPANPLAGFGTIGKSFLCAMCDGSTREIDSTIDAKSMAAIATPNGGEIVDFLPFSTVSEARQKVMNDAKDPHLNQLLAIGRAMQSYRNVHHRFPISDGSKTFDATGRPVVNFDAEGRPFLSWRVHLLPFLGQDALYQQFHMSESWDSPHNQALVERMPDIYRGKSRPGSKTPFLALTGPDAAFSKKFGPPTKFEDSYTGTILVVVVAEDKMVPWTQPSDIDFDPANPLAGLGAIPSNGIATVFNYGGVKLLKPTIPPDMFKALVTPAGKEVVDVSPYVTP